MRQELVEAFEILKQDPKRVIQVGELANVAGKIIGSVKIEIEYQQLRKTNVKIPFLETTGEQ